MSSTSPMRGMRHLLAKSVRSGASGASPRNGRSCGVSITPGEMLLTRTLRRRELDRQVLGQSDHRGLRRRSARGCRRRCPASPIPSMPAIEPTLMITPPPRRSNTGTACCTDRNTSVTSLAMFQSQSSRRHVLDVRRLRDRRVVVEDVEVAVRLRPRTSIHAFDRVLVGEVDRLQRDHFAARGPHHARRSRPPRPPSCRNRRPSRPPPRSASPPDAPGRPPCH